MCVRPADLIDNYQIQRGGVGMCDPGAGYFHDGPPGLLATSSTPKGDRPILENTTSGTAQFSLPDGVLRFLCNIKSICEQLGRTTGRLGSTDLQAMPLEGLHSRLSGA